MNMPKATVCVILNGGAFLAKACRVDGRKILIVWSLYSLSTLEERAQPPYIEKSSGFVKDFDKEIQGVLKG